MSPDMITALMGLLQTMLREAPELIDAVELLAKDARGEQKLAPEAEARTAPLAKRLSGLKSAP